MGCGQKLKKMEKFKIKEFVEDVREAKVLAKKACEVGTFIGIDTGFKMMEQVINREDVPDPMPKELIRVFINEFRKQNEDKKQKYLNNGS